MLETFFAFVNCINKKKKYRILRLEKLIGKKRNSKSRIKIESARVRTKKMEEMWFS